MPNYLRGSSRDVLTFVPLNAVFHYGWNAPDLAAALGISAGDLSTNLGHMDAATADAVPNRIMVTGANSPKPGRVVKKDPTAPTTQKGSTSTFVAYNKTAAAASDGWKQTSRPRGVSLRANVAGKRSMTAIATLSGNIRYAFPMNTADFLQFGAALGLEDASTITTSTERNTLVVGSRTKPGKASLEDSNGNFSSYFSTASEGAALAAGYNILYSEFIEFPAAPPTP